MKYSILCTASLAALGLGLMLPSVAAAQSGPAEAVDSSQGGLTDIIVTARKRSESVQQVPVAVTAVSAEVIRNQDLTSIEKIAARTPSFSVGRASNGSGAQLTMRGIGSSSTSIGIEQSVATVVDGVYYGQGRIIQEGFFDLGRIEILKGPQALFFGKNATAGVISITTADPTNTPEFRSRAAYEIKAEQVLGEAIFSGPLSDTLGARLAIRGSKMFGGYYRNVANTQVFNALDLATGAVNSYDAAPTSADQPREKELIARATLKWDPTEEFSATVKVSGDYNRVNNGSWNYSGFFCENGGRNSLNPAYQCGEKFVTHQNKLPAAIAASFPLAKKDGQLYNIYKSWQTTASLKYKKDAFEITSVTNYQWNNNSWTCACDYASSGTPTWATEDSTWRAFSSEMRALTTLDGPINVLGGALYQRTKRPYQQNVLLANLEDSSQAAEDRYASVTKVSATKGETIALFGQVTVKPVSTIEAAAGVRYTHETKDSFFTQPYVNAALFGLFRPSNSADGLGIVNASQVFNNWSPEATISWKPNRSIMVYGAYKTAYKSGGFTNGGLNSVLSASPYDDLTFNPERASGFEGGIKTTLADNQLRLNLNAYSYQYKDLQIDFFNSSIISFQTLTADARTKGVELEFEYVPRSLEGLNFHGGLNFNRARYTNFPVAPCYAGQRVNEGCNQLFSAATGGFTRQNLNGAPLSVAPRWTGSFGVSYDADVSADYIFGVSTDLRYSASYLSSGFGNEDSRQSKYATIDATLRFGRKDERWELAVIGKNLTNRSYVTGSIDGPSTGSGTGTALGIHADQQGFGSLPRTVMLQVSSHF